MFFKFNNIQISHIASCVPKNIVNLTDFASLYGELEVKKIINSTGIASIRKAGGEITTSDLCFSAAEKILMEGNISKSSIDAVVFISQTPDYRLPQTSFLLQNKLGLSENTLCFDIPLGCSGYIYGLFQASMLIHSGCNKVLLMAGDTNTKMISSRDRSVSMVFGDGGSATIVERGDGNLSSIIKSDGSGYDKLIINAGAFRNPSTRQTCVRVEREPGIYRSDEDLYMDGMAIMNFAISEVPLLIGQILEKQGWSQDEVGIYGLHQANSFMLNYLRKKMKLAPEKVPICVDNFGNTGSASIPLMLVNLYSEQEQNALLEKVILCGFGVGLSWGAIATSFANTKFHKLIEI